MPPDVIHEHKKLLSRGVLPPKSLNIYNFHHYNSARDNHLVQILKMQHGNFDLKLKPLISASPKSFNEPPDRSLQLPSGHPDPRPVHQLPTTAHQPAKKGNTLTEALTAARQPHQLLVFLVGSVHKAVDDVELPVVSLKLSFTVTFCDVLAFLVSFADLRKSKLSTCET